MNSLNKHLSDQSVPDLFHVGETAMNKQNKNICPQGSFIFRAEEQGQRQNKYRNKSSMDKNNTVKVMEREGVKLHSG